jgi:hypothetical protein
MIKFIYNSAVYTNILLFFIVLFVNVLFSANFITIFLAGIVFLVFLETYRLKYYYTLILSIASFGIIESVQGLKLFSLTLLSLFIYTFIIPKVQKTFNIGENNIYLYVAIFYFSFFIFFSFFHSLSFEVFYKVFLNYMLDTFIIGVLF